MARETREEQRLARLQALTWVFERLTAHLARVWDKRAAKLKIALSERRDQDNARDARAMAFVTHRGHTVHVAEALAQVPPVFTLGVLLHEVVHVVRSHFDGDEGEVDVDATIVEEIPGASYGYADVDYRHPVNGLRRRARNLQRVGVTFARKVLGA
jgi:hypothetical protein